MRQKPFINPIYSLLLGLLVASVCSPLFANASVSGAFLDSRDEFCEYYFFGKQAQSEHLRKELARQVEDPHRVISKMFLSPGGLSATQFLGGGYHGVVLEVLYQGRRYALKLIEEANGRDVYEPIILQKFLAEFKVAPRIHGLFRASAIAELLKSSPDVTQYFGARNFQLGVLMELVPPKFLKKSRDNNDPVAVTAAVQTRLLKQAGEYAEILKLLNIRAADMDLVVRESGDLQIVDFGSYGLKSDSFDHEVKDPKAEFTSLVSSGTYIEDASVEPLTKRPSRRKPEFIEMLKVLKEIF